jgi:hypothetical protein
MHLTDIIHPIAILLNMIAEIMTEEITAGMTGMIADDNF